MANDIPTPLAQYQQADFNERLNLYLQYPALRSQFMAIDQDEVNNRIQLHNGWLQHPLTTRLTVLLSTSVGCVRRRLAPAKF